MPKKSKIALVVISVICGLSASFFGYNISRGLFDTGLGIGHLITPFQFAKNTLLPFFCVVVILTLPTLIPRRFQRSLKIFRFIVAILALVTAFVSSFITVSESVTLWYAINFTEKLPSFVCAATITFGTFFSAVILLWPEISGRFLKAPTGLLVLKVLII